MTDITPDFNLCLQKHNVPPILHKDYNLQTLNSFLQEAYSINARITDLHRELLSIRPAYLSAVQPSRRRLPANAANQKHAHQSLTTGDRDSIDAHSKSLLRSLHSAISNLHQASQVKSQTASSVALSKRAKTGLGGLGRWAAGGAQTALSPEEHLEEGERKTLEAVRESVVVFLRGALERVGRLQSEMMDARLRREVEKGKSVLARARVESGIPNSTDLGTGDTGDMNGNIKKKTRQSADFTSDPSLSSDPTSSLNLTPEQTLLFASENNDLLNHYNTQLSSIQGAEKSILEISELHSTLHANLAQQSEHIEQLVADSYLTTENLGKGNKELKRASERKSTAQAVFYGTVVFCGVLVVWDLVF
ncbi:unnamed protein product [Zymoseptoria tritici ST99CH_1A5]|uniref:SNARE-complex protein Syntaxin-18 N-terminal domain-containing protein n=3 Tax=Zymoseptoria tritici TaxID=1047171 RepID=A0A1X7RUW4_ZYMT9|nr:unnamed protein product [Zymoseptoria tritici ST99CH_3D7]SMR52900.1 unnamed protein product [Zymoseptoria tritici ST99CH_1E4]SMR54326.1 unnamed protein product [Zymoseptoria tritici ST99CH_3D1]SMY24645.1 unnamed protein product [Zymoseptoria tritici ST99CH_1A5]